MVILFDLVGTLIGVKSSVGAQYARIARCFGIEARGGALDEAFKQVLPQMAPFALPAAGRTDLGALEREAWRAIVTAVFERAGLEPVTKAPVFAPYFDALFEHFGSAAAYDLFPDARPAIDTLLAAGHRLGLVTNFDSRIWSLLDDLRLRECFASVTIPALAGAAKPDPAIFRRALDTLGATASDGVSVGDSIADDVAGAQAVGLTAVLIDRSGVIRQSVGFVRIRSLNDLPALVGRG